jgi:hypothetical protein
VGQGNKESKEHHNQEESYINSNSSNQMQLQQLVQENKDPRNIQTTSQEIKEYNNQVETNIKHNSSVQSSQQLI